MGDNVRAEPFEIGHRKVLSIALPMILTFLSTPLLGIVDTTVIGNLGLVTPLAAIAIGTILFDLIFSVLNFLRYSTAGLIAQATGRDDKKDVLEIVGRSIVIAIVVGLILILLQTPLAILGLDLLGATDDVRELAFAYFEIRIWSAPFSLMNFALMGILVGMARTSYVLVLATFMNGLNILFNLLFVVYLDMSVPGLAFGTLIAEVATTILGFFIIHRLLSDQPWPRLASLFQPAEFRQMLALNGDFFIRSLCLVFAFAFFTAQSARLGDATLAANEVLLKFLMVSAYFLDGIAAAAEQLAGRSLGARWRDGFIRTVKLTILWGSVLAAGNSFVFLIIGATFIDLMTSNSEVRMIAASYLPWVIVAPVISTLAYQMDGVFMGATWAKDLRNMMLLSVGVFLAIWYVALPSFGNNGLWLALVCFLGARGLTLLVICVRRLRSEQDFAS